MAYTSFPDAITDEWLAEQKARVAFVDAQPEPVRKLVDLLYACDWKEGDAHVTHLIRMAELKKASEPSPYLEAYTAAAGEYAMACEYNG